MVELVAACVSVETCLGRTDLLFTACVGVELVAAWHCEEVELLEVMEIVELVAAWQCDVQALVWVEEVLVRELISAALRA